jgi:hypothetical protein
VLAARCDEPFEYPENASVRAALLLVPRLAVVGVDETLGRSLPVP